MEIGSAFIEVGLLAVFQQGAVLGAAGGSQDARFCDRRRPAGVRYRFVAPSFLNGVSLAILKTANKFHKTAVV